MQDILVNDLHVTQINQCYYESGATRPINCSLSNNGIAVVKYINNREGNRTLINEFLCAKFASCLHLNIPKCGICLFDSRHELKDVARLEREHSFEITSDNYGIAFYSAFIPNSTPVLRPMIPYIVNGLEFVKMIVFDHVIYNTDRHAGNILVSNQKALKFYIIDHSHVFKNQAIWDAQTFIQGMRDHDYNDKRILEENRIEYGMFFESISYDRNSIFDECERIKRCLTPEIVDNAFCTLPQQWISDIPHEELELLEDYINYRVRHLIEIGALICNERGI